MRHSIPFAALALATLSAVSPGAAPGPAAGSLDASVAAGLVQDPPAPADGRAELKALTEKLAGHIDKRGKEDAQAKESIDKLLIEFRQSGPKDREAIVKALDKCFQVKRPENKDGAPDNGLYLAAAVALGEMGPESVKPLISWIGNRAHKKDLVLQRMLITRLGKTKSEEGRKFLLKLLDEPEPPIVAAAAESLGEFDGVDQKIRKELFEELLKLLMGAKNEYDAANTDPILRERYDTIAAPIVSSLQRLSKQRESDPQRWQHWWNKNKKEDWDQLGP
jgi:HEAT repeat protein